MYARALKFILSYLILCYFSLPSFIKDNQKSYNKTYRKWNYTSSGIWLQSAGISPASQGSRNMGMASASSNFIVCDTFTVEADWRWPVFHLFLRFLKKRSSKNKLNTFVVETDLFDKRCRIYPLNTPPVIQVNPGDPAWSIESVPFSLEENEYCAPTLLSL